MANRLINKRIVITGAVDNIGKAAVEAFVAEGGRVAIGDINDERGNQLVSTLGESAAFFHVDVTHEDEVGTFVSKATSWLGGLDVLCQNAGVQIIGDLVDFATADWDRSFAINIRAQFLGAKYAIPALKASGKGSIVNMASIAGVRGVGGATAYCASKGAVVLLTHALARELGPFNIRVNAICPGWVDTAFNSPIIGYLGGPAKHAQIVKDSVPLGRQGTPQEVAPLYVFLASDESSFISGQAMLVDGGVHN